VPAALSEIVARCLKRNVDDRFENVVSLAEALAPYAWYKHHEALARMRRAVGVRRQATPGTSSASVPPAAMTGNGVRPQGDGGAANKVLLALAAVVPLVLIPLAGFLVVQRVGMGHRPPIPDPVPTATETAAQPAPTEAVLVVPPPSAAMAITAPSASTQSAPDPGGAPIPVEELPTMAPSSTAQPVRVPPKKRSILQQRY
jgi:hypothetical protein